MPTASSDADLVLKDRTEMNDVRFVDRIRSAEAMWLLAPSGINILTPDNIEAIRSHILRKSTGNVRILTLNPSADAAVRIADQQLYASLEYSTKPLDVALHEAILHLQAMKEWPTPGSVEHRTIDFSPGFSLLAIDPMYRHGRLIVEFHAYRNSTTSTRMHIELQRSQTERWYDYWMMQFEHAWTGATPLEGKSGSTHADRNG